MTGRRHGAYQLMRFLAGGVGCALIDVGLMWWLLHLHVAPLLAATFGFITGLLANYTYHTMVTFRSAFSPGAFMRFMAVVLVNYLVTLAAVAIAVHLAHGASVDGALIGKIVALPLVAVISFLLSKYWVYT